MMKTFPILFIILLIIACNKKAIPVITSRTADPPAPAQKVIDVKPDLAAGKMIFMNRCGRCHDLPKPEQYTAQRWDGILSFMIPRARLTDEQGVHVKAYLKSNAAK